MNVGSPELLLHKLRAELRRRSGLKGSLFEKQRLFVESKVSRKKAAITTRRAGKSVAAATILLVRALLFPGAKSLFIGLTKGSAELIIWEELKRINEEHNLGVRFHNVKMRATLPNRHIIAIVGADNLEWIEQYRGIKIATAVIDEAASFRASLDNLIRNVLEPATADLRGEIYMLGTAGSIQRGLFFDVTSGLKSEGWDVHRWTWRDNPYVVREMGELVESLRRENKDVESLPWFRREYCGEWVLDSNDLVYLYDRTRNCAPFYQKRFGDRYILGIDFGWDDPNGFAVCCYNPDADNKLYVLETYRHPKMQLSEIAEKCHEYMAKYPGIQIVSDHGARRQLTEELGNRYSVPITTLTKTYKEDWIDIINVDMSMGRVIVVDPYGLNKQIDEEVSMLRWRWMRGMRPIETGESILGAARKEDPSCRNDCCDALLYAFRESYHYTHEKPQEKPGFGTRAYWDVREKEIEKENIEEQENAFYKKGGFR